MRSSALTSPSVFGIFLFAILVGLSSILRQMGSLEKTVVTVEYVQSNNPPFRLPPTIASTIHKKQKPSGRFNGLDLIYVNDTSRVSTIHCIGENYLDNAWLYRSCHYTHFCFDYTLSQFLLVLPDDDNLQHETVKTAFLSLAGQGMAAQREGWDQQRWTPQLLNTSNVTGYYALPDNTLWIPFYPSGNNVQNPGHALWDHLLPLFTLVHNFFPYKEQDSTEVTPNWLLANTNVHCTHRSRHRNGCYDAILPYLPLIGLKEEHMAPIRRNNIRWFKGHEARSNLVCAKHGVAGIGMLTDHGTQGHGQYHTDYVRPHNVGRIDVWHFRNFVLRNLHLHNRTRSNFQVTLSIHSSTKPNRDRDFAKLQEQLPNRMSMKIQAVQLDQLPLKEQIEIATQTRILISVMGGGTMTATFLPRHASLILYFDDIGEEESLRRATLEQTRELPQAPQMMDWDFWNHAATWIRVHWLPLSSLDRDDGGLFQTLVNRELQATDAFFGAPGSETNNQ